MIFLCHCILNQKQLKVFPFGSSFQEIMFDKITSSNLFFFFRTVQWGVEIHMFMLASCEVEASVTIPDVHCVPLLSNEKITNKKSPPA